MLRRGAVVASARSAPDSTLGNKVPSVVVQLIAESHTNKQVAKILQFGLKTVDTHRLAIMRNLDLPSCLLLCGTQIATR